MKLYPILGLTILLSACAANSEFPRAAAADWPAGTIETAEGVFQVPLGQDKNGCMMYQTKIPGAKTTQVIKYRKKDGSFTMNRAEADCPAVADQD
ncbi:hypothetical protein [Emcibacter nanhaiensis]|uniref:Lipoprotein n=1 Tax=Emcibacter nanhaiensis TaxID=1505037 RepID=A0A501PMP1_9PROT|nr:hypothetical protein [Emcibacter nanhaiensis]TPD61770.1 hypothetical protein FIV46_06060 [Emcibacter nanhaiensis]